LNPFQTMANLQLRAILVVMARMAFLVPMTVKMTVVLNIQMLKRIRRSTISITSIIVLITKMKWTASERSTPSTEWINSSHQEMETTILKSVSHSRTINKGPYL